MLIRKGACYNTDEMEEKLYRKIETKYCLLTHKKVTATTVFQAVRVADGSLEEQAIALECLYSGKCLKQSINCRAVDPDRGKDPFTIERNLLADLW